MLETNRSTKGSLEFLSQVEDFLLSKNYKRHKENTTKVDRKRAIGISWSKDEYWFFKNKTSKQTISNVDVQKIINGESHWWF